MPGSQVSVCCCCEKSLWIRLVKNFCQKSASPLMIHWPHTHVPEKTDHPLVDRSTCRYQTLYAPATGCGKQASAVPRSVCNSQLLLWFTLVSCCRWLPCKATCDCDLRLALAIWLSWMPWGQAGWGLWPTPGWPHAEWYWWWGNEQAAYGPVLDPGWSTWKGKYMNYLQVQGPIHTSSDIKNACW